MICSRFEIYYGINLNMVLRKVTKEAQLIDLAVISEYERHPSSTTKLIRELPNKIGKDPTYYVGVTLATGDPLLGDVPVNIKKIAITKAIESKYDKIVKSLDKKYPSYSKIWNSKPKLYLTWHTYEYEPNS